MNDSANGSEESNPSFACHKINDPFGTVIYYMGPPLDQGALPAFFYFSLSGEESLTLAPYNSPALGVATSALRVFSFTIPCHGEDFDKFKAMECWNQKFCVREPFLEEFFNGILKAIEWLIFQNIVDPLKMAAGGLSRGAFIATHLASLEQRIKYLLGYAPLTTLTAVTEFEQFPSIDLLKNWDLEKKIDPLLHLKALRFYCGLNDTRIGTQACFSFVEQLSKVAIEKRVKDLSVELLLRTSIGHKGHGTSLEVFLEGSEWVKNKLLN